MLGLGLDIPSIGVRGGSTGSVPISWYGDVSALADLSSTLDVSTESTLPYCLRFGDGGAKLYIGSWSSFNALYQYDLSSDYDVSTAVYSTKELAFASAPYGFDFSTDGTKLIVAVAAGNLVQYALSTAWDLSTASVTTTKVMGVANVGGLCFSTSGKHLYMFSDPIDNSNQTLTEYPLTTAFTISTLGTATHTHTMPSVRWSSIDVSTSGTYMYLTNRTISTPTSIIRWTFGTKWALSSMYNWEESNLTFLRNTGVAFNADASQLYLLRDESDDVKTYSSTP